MSATLPRAFGKFVIAIEPAGKLLLDLVAAIRPAGVELVWGNQIFHCSQRRSDRPFITILNDLSRAVDEVSKHWRQAWADLKKWADDGYQHIKSAIFDPLVNFFTVTIPSVFDQVVVWFTALPGRIVTALGDIVDKVFGALKKVGDWLENNVWNPVSSWFKQLPTRLAQKSATSSAKRSWRSPKPAHGSRGTCGLPWPRGSPGCRVGSPERSGTSSAGHSSTFRLSPSGSRGTCGHLISNFFSGLGTRIGQIAVGMWDGVANAFIDAINAIINAWDSLHFTVGGGSFLGISVPSFTLGTPHIDDLSPIGHKAAGGPVDAGMPYFVGERGIEFFMPNVSGSIIPNHSLPDFAALAGGSSRPVGGPLMSVGEQHIHSAVDVQAVGQQLAFLHRGRRL